MDRTIKLKLNTTPEQDASLLASMSGFTQAFNYLCQYGWEHNLKNNVKLQRECYYTLKLLMPDMPVQLFVAASHKSAESLKSAFSHLRNFPDKLQKRKFLGKRYWKEITQRSFRLKRKLQAAGTKSAKRHLRKLSGKVQRFRKDCDHVLSKRIVQSCSTGTTLVIEDLTEIRETTEQRGRESRRRLHSWSFAQLRSFLNYKAEAAGMRVVAIDPRHTSQTCSKCGYQSRSNRKSQSLFLCKECAYQLNADLNAAYNIRDKHLATLGISLGSGPPSIGLSSPSSDEGQATAL